MRSYLSDAWRIWNHTIPSTAFQHLLSLRCILGLSMYDPLSNQCRLSTPITDKLLRTRRPQGHVFLYTDPMFGIEPDRHGRSHAVAPV